jgi:hypothetical protein
MRSWLVLLDRLAELPIDQLHTHMARDLADELGLAYAQVRDSEVVL